jgi:hypothetical protein
MFYYCYYCCLSSGINIVDVFLLLLLLFSNSCTATDNGIQSLNEKDNGILVCTRSDIHCIAITHDSIIIGPAWDYYRKDMKPKLASQSKTFF